MKKMVFLVVVMFAVTILAGCGNNTADQEKKEAEMNNEIKKQQQEIDELKKNVEQKGEKAKNVAKELATDTCKQKLALAQTQLELLENHTKSLMALDKQVKKTPALAVETCRSVNPGLSKPECDKKINDYAKGKKTEYKETQARVTTIKKEITELEKKCSNKTDEQLLGSDRDEHGCIGSAGYEWSEKKQKCIRPWEEK